MQEALRWIETQQDRMVGLLQGWSGISSYSYDVAGLRRMADALCVELEGFGAVEQIDLPAAESIDAWGNIRRDELGQALRVVKRPDAAKRVLLNIHYDTV